MKTYPAIAIANFFIKKSITDERCKTNLALQKLVFFAHANALHSTGIPLVSDPCTAWPYGPVFVPLYHALKRFGDQPIDSLIQIAAFDENNNPVAVTPQIANDDEETAAYLEDGWQSLSGFSAGRLVAASHQRGGAWFETVQAFVPDPSNIDDVFRLLPHDVTIFRHTIERCGR